jgi:hypothetical protein
MIRALGTFTVSQQEFLRFCMRQLLTRQTGAKIIKLTRHSVSAQTRRGGCFSVLCRLGYIPMKNLFGVDVTRGDTIGRSDTRRDSVGVCSKDLALRAVERTPRDMITHGEYDTELFLAGCTAARRRQASVVGVDKPRLI